PGLRNARLKSQLKFISRTCFETLSTSEGQPARKQVSRMNYCTISQRIKSASTACPCPSKTTQISTDSGSAHSSHACRYGTVHMVYQVCCIDIQLNTCECHTGSSHTVDLLPI